MQYTYKNAVIKIDDKDIVAENISLSMNAELNGVFTEGRKNSYAFTPINGINGTLQISYYLTGSDPIRSYITSEEGSMSGYFGGISIPSGYLTSYSSEFAPNQMIKANANISFFNSPTGTFTPTYNQSSEKLKYLNVSDISITGHSLGNLDDVELIRYQYSQNVAPQYHIGDISPRKVVSENKQLSMAIQSAHISGVLPHQGSSAYLQVSLSHPRLPNFSDSIFIDGVVTTRSINTSSNDTISNNLTIEQNYLTRRPRITSLSRTQTSGGDNITIGGTNMKNTKKVLFCINGETVPRKEETFSILSDSAIRVTVPLGASRGMIEILSD